MSLLRRSSSLLRRSIPRRSDETNYAALSKSLGKHAAYGEVVSYNRTVIPIANKYPNVFENVFVAPGSSICGDVTWNIGGSAMYGVVVRGDLNAVKLGAWTHVNQHTVINTIATLDTGFPATMSVGNYTFIGSNCTLTSCEIGHRVTIEDGVTVCEGAVIEEGAIIQAGSVVPPGRLVGAKEIWAGCPAEKVGERSDYDYKIEVEKAKQHHRDITDTHADEFLPHGTAYWQMEGMIDASAPQQS